MRRAERWLGFIIINKRFVGSVVLLLSTWGEDNRSGHRRWCVTVRKLIHSCTHRPAKGFKGRSTEYPKSDLMLTITTDNYTSL